MKISFFTFIIIFLTTTIGISQFRELPLQTNSDLLKGEISNIQRGLVQESLTLYVATSTELTWCLDTTDFEFSPSSTTDQQCSSSGADYELNNFCITFRAGDTERSDLLCIRVCDTVDNCRDLEIEVITQVPVNLPFIDDFSSTAPYPNPDRWIDKNVFINNRLAQDPVTVGVATFDGIGPEGEDYGGGFGFSDALTSCPLDLSGDGAVWLSFFLQPKGLGLIPRTTDSLVVDFRDKEGQWRRIEQYRGLMNDVAPANPAPAFEFYVIEVSEEFKYRGFQFRFRNKSKNEGLQELWHLDYVRVTRGSRPGPVITDMGFTDVPGPVTSPYTHMPWRHLTPDYIKKDYEVHIRNLFDEEIFLTGGEFSVSEPQTGSVIISRTLLEPPGPIIRENQRDLDPGLHIFNNPLDQLDPGYVARISNYTPPDESTIFIKEYNISLRNAQQNSQELIKTNNAVQRATIFSNFMSYDDGTAESAIITDNSPGVETQVAVEFTTTVDDTLKGIQLSLPRLQDSDQGLRMNLFVWVGELEGEPDYEQLLVTPVFVDEFFDSLQGFTTYAIVNSNDEQAGLFIPAGKFYIGYEQSGSSSAPEDARISVGFDKNTGDGTDFMFFNVGEDWLNVGETNQTLNGTLMVRAVLSGEEVISTSTQEADWLSKIRIYPNPAENTLYLDAYGEADLHRGNIRVMDLYGRIVLETPWTQFLDLSALTPGIYPVMVNRSVGTPFFCIGKLIKQN